MDVIILASIAVGLLLLIAALWFITKSGKTASADSAQQQNATILPGARRRQPVFSRRGGGVGGRAAAAAEQEDDEDDGGQDLEINLPEGKVGAKKMAKLQAKAEKKAHREAEQRDRDERKQKQAKEDEERKKAEDKEKEEERKREAELKRIQEEKEQREHEEYLKMKEAFSVESEGYEEGAQEPENSLQNFVNYIKNNKVVVLEDLAGQFGMKTAAAIQRVDTLQSDGILSGVMDDRGKFIFISPEEMKAVANFVRQRGRVSIAELVDSSNQLVDLTPKIAA